jgi:hypothetical protein
MNIYYSQQGEGETGVTNEKGFMDFGFYVRVCG